MATNTGREMHGAETPTQLSAGQYNDIKEPKVFSSNAILWIHLYHDLLLAIARTPARPPVATTDGIVYQNFSNHFKSESFANDKERFIHERKSLLPTRLDMIDSAFKHDKSENTPVIYRITITSELLDHYSVLRSDWKLEKEIADPEHTATLWEFLNDVAHKAYPELYASMSNDQDLASKNVDRVGQFHTRETEARTRALRTVPAPVPNASQHAYLSHTAASSSSLSSRSTMVMVFKNIILEDERAIKADGSPDGDQVRVQRLRTTDIEELSGDEAADRAPSTNSSEEITAPAPKRARETASTVLSDQLAEEAQPAKKRTKITMTTTTTTTTEKSEAESTQKSRTRWTDNEVNCIHRCINNYCKEKGVNTFTRSRVVDPCVEALQKECANEHQGKTRTRVEVDSKIMNLGRYAKDGVSSIRTLEARAAELKDKLASGETLSQVDQYPAEFLPRV